VLLVVVVVLAPFGNSSVQVYVVVVESCCEME
jgi:hypothetical protein